MVSLIQKSDLKYYTEVHGVLVRKYRGFIGNYILVFDENGTETKIKAGRAIFHRIDLGTKWTVGHIKGKIINIRPGFLGSGITEDSNEDRA